MQNQQILRRLTAAAAAVGALTICAQVYAADPVKRLLDLQLKKGIITQQEYDEFMADIAAPESEPKAAKESAEIQEFIKAQDHKKVVAYVEKHEKDATVNAGEQGFSLKSADGQFEYKLRGVLSVDYRHFDNNAFPAAVDGFLGRSIKPTFEGTVFGKYGFRFTPEFGESGDGSGTTSSTGQNKVRVNDAYLDIKESPAFQLRIGKHKPFVGLERLQSDEEIKFIERSYVSNMVLPNRDFGVTAYGELFKGKLSYAGGFFNGSNDGGGNSTAIDVSTGKEYTARLFAKPWAGTDGSFKELAFGVAATHGTGVGSSSSTTMAYKSAGQSNSFFTYVSSAIPYGDRTRWSPQAYFYRGPFGMLAEYAVVSEGIATSTAGANTKTISNEASQMYVSWMLTGENASYKGIKPFSPFKSGSEGGWGALEVLARWQSATIDQHLFSATTWGDNSKANAQQADTLGIGVNWYLNQSSKFVLNYDHTEFSGKYIAGTSAAKRLSGTVEDVIMARYQLAF
jgi:phosphate-selective porin OprO/OprP